MSRLSAAAACALALFVWAAPLQAHPMPDTEVSVARGAQVISLVIHVPFSDLKLALPQQTPRDSQVLLRGNQPELRAYFAAHTRLSTRRGQAVPITIGTIRLNQQRDANVGRYSELEVSVSARIGGGEPLSLAYDGVLHRIANHRAIVRDAGGKMIGIVRYSLATKTATALLLPSW